MSRLESPIQSAVKGKMERHGWTVKKLFNIPGWPDLICLRKPGITIFIETKAPGKIPEPLQLYVHGFLRSLGFKVYVIDSVKDITNEIINSR